MEKTAELKPGTRVKLRGGNLLTDVGAYSIGDEFEVVKAHKGELFGSPGYLLKPPSGKPALRSDGMTWIGMEDLDLAETSSPTFKLGDLVRSKAGDRVFAPGVDDPSILLLPKRYIGVKLRIVDRPDCIFAAKPPNVNVAVASDDDAGLRLYVDVRPEDIEPWAEGETWDGKKWTVASTDPLSTAIRDGFVGKSGDAVVKAGDLASKPGATVPDDAWMSIPNDARCVLLASLALMAQVRLAGAM